MKKLTLADPPRRFGGPRPQEPALPTWGQIKKLTQQAEKMVRDTQQQVTPQHVFLAMIALLSFQAPGANAAVHWAYVPDPPMFHPISWGLKSVPVYTNSTWAMGGVSSSHLKPVTAENFTYFGESKELPICLTRKGNVSGYMQSALDTERAIFLIRLMLMW